MDFIEQKAYAKINLDLYITGKRSDGYHLLSTHMQSVDIFDSVKIKKNFQNEIRVFLDGNEDPYYEKNTAYRAALLMKEKFGLLGYDISIQKNIPMEAGLGGSSADAAAVINGICRIEELNVSEDVLCELGAGIGADVPFMIFGGCAHCLGIGEKLVAVRGLCNCNILVAKPAMGVSTKQAFLEYDSLKGGKVHWKNMTDALEKESLLEVSKCLHNDLEEVAIKLCPEIKTIKEIFVENEALGCLMTGSGSSVYAIYEKDYNLNPVIDMLKKKIPNVVVVGTVPVPGKKD